MKWFMALSLALLGLPLSVAHEVIIDFDGNGTAMAYGGGVMKAFYERMDPKAIGETYFVGSSSGSIMAAYFSCRGLTQSSVDGMISTAARFPKDYMDEETGLKSAKLFLGIPPEVTLERIQPLLNEMTENGACVPKFPVLIPAANLDVIEGRTKKPFAGIRGRKFDQGSYTLSNKDGTVRGKVCTYFINKEMAAILEAVPAAERLCDTRLIRNGVELKEAVERSISEPTYYLPLEEKDMSQLQSVYPLPKRRFYAGGFIMNTAVQDLKRARPEAYAVATGRVHYQRIQNRIIQNWFSFPMNKTLFDQRWFVDIQSTPNKQDQARLYETKTTPTEQVALGYAQAMKCYRGDANTCLPKVFTVPKYSKSGAGKDMKALRHRGIKVLLKAE